MAEKGGVDTMFDFLLFLLFAQESQLSIMYGVNALFFFLM